MAEYDPEDEARRQREAQQRLDAAAAVRASQNQPNAIPNEAPATDFGNTRAVDYAQRGLPLGNAVRGDPDPNAPRTGFYINQAGENLGPTAQPATGNWQSNPPGAVGIQGQLSPQEQAFWAANPNGAVKDPETGNLIGLGAAAPINPQESVVVNAGLGPPTVVAQPQRTIPDFVHIPGVDPAVVRQKQMLQNEIQITRDALAGASTVSYKGQPSQRAVLQQKLDTLVRGYNGLGSEHGRQLEQQRLATDKNRALQNKWSIDQDVMEANKAISQLDPSDPDYKKKYFQITEQYGNAMRDPKFKAAAMDDARYHAGREQARQRAAEAGLIPQITGYGSKGETEKYVPADPLKAAVEKKTQDQVAKDFAKSGLTPEQFAQRNTVVGTDKEGKQVENPDHVKVQIGDHHYLMSNEAYARLNTAVPATQPNPAAPGQGEKGNQSNEVQRTTSDGRQAIFDSKTKKFLRYAQ